MKEIGGYFQLEEMPEEPQVQENPITVFSV